ncbi:MAG: hypothetical protein AB1512_32545 [Thermodesulfobacteriota bacterium]
MTIAQFIAAVLAEGLVDREVLLTRIEALRVDEGLKIRIRERALSDLSRITPS